MIDRTDGVQGESESRGDEMGSLQKQYAYLLHQYCLRTGAQSTSYPGLLGQVKADCGAVTARGGVSLEWLAKEHEKLAADLHKTPRFTLTSAASELAPIDGQSQSAKPELDISNGSPQ